MGEFEGRDLSRAERRSDAKRNTFCSSQVRVNDGIQYEYFITYKVTLNLNTLNT
jgi:hypothetical protein